MNNSPESMPQLKLKKRIVVKDKSLKEVKEYFNSDHVETDIRKLFGFSSAN